MLTLRSSALADSDFLAPLRIGSGGRRSSRQRFARPIESQGQAGSTVRASGRIKLKPGTEAKFAAEAAKVAKATATEPGNEMFVFFQHMEQPGTVILFEKWKNLAALQAHLRRRPHHTLAQVHRRHWSRGDDRHSRAIGHAESAPCRNGRGPS